jgi:hypothetical protein
MVKCKTNGWHAIVKLIVSLSLIINNNNSLPTIQDRDTTVEEGFAKKDNYCKQE